MSYMSDYIRDIDSALQKMTVTDSLGNPVDVDSALALYAGRVEHAKAEKGLVFFCGNGASCSMAEHMSHDHFQNAVVNTQTCSETSHITAISNDISYENVFSYRINRILSERDMLVTISSSGNSPNIIKAIEAARENGSYIVTFSGKKCDNASRRLGDLNFYVPLETYGMVESAHATMLHACLDYYLDAHMGGRH